MKSKRTFKPGQFAVTSLSRLIIWIVIIVSIIPMLYVVSASFNPGQSDFSASLIPPNASFANYIALFKTTDFGIWIRNSTEVALVVATAQMFMTAIGAYAFSRLRFYGRKYGLMALILLQMFPGVLSVSAIYAELAQLSLLDNLWVYILIQIGGSAFNIWLVKGYYDTIPRELDEAAIMDGAGHWRIFWKIILPLARPMLAVIFFLTLIGMYSEYLMANTILQSPQNFTLGMGMYSMVSGQFATHLWGEFAAAALISAVPLTVAFGFLNPLISKGLTAGSVKG
ncbi:MAG: sugar ABC transporter permease [Firmicutes bacterium]|nr:sugar ABC transporter permease [Bacillota bacterium]